MPWDDFETADSQLASADNAPELWGRPLKNVFLYCWGLVFLLWIGLAPESVAQRLSLVGSDGSSIDLPVPASDTVKLMFYDTGILERQYDILLGAFLSDDDESASVSVVPPAAGNTTKATDLRFTKDEHLADLDLRIGDVIPGVKYTGTITVFLPEPQSWQITLHQPDPLGELIADVTKVELEVEIYSLWRIFSRDNPSFSITLGEKSGKKSLQGIRIRRATDAEVTPELDIKNLKFSLDGMTVANLESYPVDDTAQMARRNIAPGQQRILKLEIIGAPVGEHTLMIELGAQNAKPGTAPNIEIVAKVRHAIGLPLFALFLAIGFSIFFTRVIVNWRERLNMHKRTQALNRHWLGELGNLAPIVWLKATRKRAQKVLAKFRLLTIPGEQSENLDTAERLLEMLLQYRDLDRQLKTRNFPYMLNWRLETKLDDIIGRIEPEMLDQVAATAVQTELEGFKQSLIDPAATYKEDVLMARRKVKQRVSLEALQEIMRQLNQSAEVQNAVSQLMTDHIEADLPDNPTEDQLVLVDRVCTSLRILWKHRQDEDTLKQLLDLIAKDDANNIQFQRVLALANKAVWDKIVDAVENGNAQIFPSTANPRVDPVEALWPTRYQVVFKDKKLDDDFIAKTRMEAHWSFMLQTEAKKPRWKVWQSSAPPPKTIEWSTNGQGKTLFQFAPEAGKLTTQVVLQHENGPSDAIQAEIDIQASSRTFWQRLLAVEQGMLVVVSAALALIGGLVLYYYSEPTFGTFKDYVALITWGVGVDQGKNFVGNLGQLKSQSTPDDG